MTRKKAMPATDEELLQEIERNPGVGVQAIRDAYAFAHEAGMRRTANKQLLVEVERLKARVAKAEELAGLVIQQLTEENS